MNSTNATQNTRNTVQKHTNMFYGKLDLPPQFRNHRELVAGESSHARKIAVQVDAELALAHREMRSKGPPPRSGFRINLYNSQKGPNAKVSFRECNMVRLSANSASALRRCADLLKKSILSLSKQQQKLTKIVKVSPDKVGHVIGKGGETVKGISRKVGEGTRIQYEEEKGGFVVSGYKQSAVDWAVTLIQKQADAFKVPVKAPVSTEVDLTQSLFTYQQYDGKQKNQAKWDVRKKMAQEINPETGGKLFEVDIWGQIPWKKVDEKMADMESQRTEQLSMTAKNESDKLKKKQQAELSVEGTFPEEFEAKKLVVDEKWTTPSAMVFDPTVRAPPPPPPPAPIPTIHHQEEEEEVELDGWELDANENCFTGGTLMTNVDPERLAEAQRQMAMDDEYEEFMRQQVEDEEQRELEETHYDEMEDDNWHRF